MRDSHESVHSKDRKKEETTINKDKLATSGVARSLGVYTIESGGGGSKDSSIGRASSFSVPQTKGGAQPSIRTMIKKGRRKNQTGFRGG